jgi:hypothetical protein
MFTLVGIAGEDDQDAPDLPVIKLHGGTAGPSQTGKINGHAASSMMSSSQPVSSGSQRKPKVSAPILDADASGAFSRTLTAEIAGIGSVGHAIEWARKNIGAKNTLTTGDAGAVETAFRDRMEALESQSLSPELSNDDLSAGLLGAALPAASTGPGYQPRGEPAALARGHQTENSGTHPATRVDKSILTLAEPRRYRNKDHLRFVAQQPCLVCGRTPSDPHHLRFTQPRALGRKVSDEFVAPLCRTHHREVHRVGDERAWWKRAGIDPIKVARKLWRKTRLAERAMRREPSVEPPRAEPASEAAGTISAAPL